MEISKSAPIVIPTLNRDKHFKACLESLEKCLGAENTDVYVALDFPPSERYIEGWRKIDLYLAEKEKSNGFNQLIVIRRDKNCGVGHNKSNGSLLRDYVMTLYDRYIFTEDDNVFSYRFLEYMNMCLEKYKDDDTIYAVTGYNHPIDMPKVQASVVKLQEMSAWGCGFWKKKLLSRQETISLIDDMLADKNLRRHFTKRRPSIYAGLMHMKSNNAIWGDCFNTAYEYYSDKYCIFPIVSLVQNHGWDGTGTHGGVVKGYSDQTIEGEVKEPFVVKEAEVQETMLIDNAVVKYWKRYEGGIHNVVDNIEIAIYSLTGKIVMFDTLKTVYKKIRSRIQK